MSAKPEMDPQLLRQFNAAKKSFSNLSSIQMDAVEVEGKLVIKGSVNVIDFDLWVDDGTFFLQVLPAGGKMAFPDIEYAQREIDNIFARAFGTLGGVSALCQLSGWRAGYSNNPHVCRRSDPSRASMDCWNIQLAGLSQKPLVEKALLDCLRRYDEAIQASPLAL